MSNVSNLAEAREARRLQQPHKQGGKGFALLHRKIMDVPFYKDPEAAHLWVHLLLRANYEQTLVSTDVGDVICDRGEFITGRNTLAMETGLTADRVKALLRKFHNLGMITTKSNNRFTVLRVVKYDEYQSNFCPADVQPVSTDKEVINISSTNVEESTVAQPKAEKKKSSVSCQQVIDTYHELLPEAPKIRALNDRRKNSIQTFWRKAGVITRQLDGHGFTLEDWKSYLSYVATNCRWMFEERTNHQRGTVWHKKGLDFLLNDNTYLKVREGEHDDR